MRINHLLRRQLPATALLCALLVGLLGCKEESHCRKPCARVAMCKSRVVVGEPILGDKPPPPDRDCLKRCRDKPEEWAKCEGKKRLCSELRLCRGSYRE